MIVANRNAAGVYRPVPKPVANGTLNSIAEIGAAPVTATKITPHIPTALGLRRSTPEAPAYTDSTAPSWRTSSSGSGGLMVAMRPLLLVARLLRKTTELSDSFGHSTTTGAAWQALR